MKAVSVFDNDLPKWFGRRENVRSPSHYRVEPQGRRSIRAAKVARASWERARCGCTQVGRVAEVGRMYRASSTPGGRKASWSTRALARRKPVSPPDAGHGWREGESVRALTFSISSRERGLRVSACRLSIRRKAFSDHRLFDLYGKGSTESSGS